MIGASRTDESFLADKATQDWVNMIVRGSVACPEDIDDLLAPTNPLAQKKSGHVIFQNSIEQTLARDPAEVTRPTITVVLDDAKARIPDAKSANMAMRYAALAVEKECELVVLTHQNNSGFERFGFRVERIAGRTKTQRQACVDQLLQFWGAEIVI